MIQVINRAFRILEYIAEKPEEPHFLSDITAHVQLNIATTARILETLVEEGYVEQLGRKKGYILGPMAYSIASKGPYRKDLVISAGPVVRDLAKKTGETALIAIVRRFRRFVVLKIDGTHDIQVRSDSITVEKVYPTATGRVLLAYAPEAEQKNFVDSAGLPGKEEWPEARSWKKLTEYLAALREKEMEIVALSGQFVGVGVPIWENDRVTAALGLYLPSYRFTGEHKDLVINSIKQSAQEISKRLSRR